MSQLVVVTGGSRGIGREIVKKFLSIGCHVCFTYKNSTNQANELVEIDPELCQAYQVDHANADEIRKFSVNILRAGVPAILVNCVGMNQDEIFFNQEFEKFWELIQLNFGSAVLLSKLLLPAMMERRSGHIINISSIAANKPKIGNSAYGASKIALERFSKSLALEVARFNIHVNCIAPGYVESDMLDAYLANHDKNSFYKQIPMRATLIPEDVANTVLALFENKIKTTGSVITIGHGENIH